MNNILTNNNTEEYDLDIQYEQTAAIKSTNGVVNNQVVPNGKYAQFKCVKKNGTRSSSSSLPLPPLSNKLKRLFFSNRNAKPLNSNIIRRICQNGKWIGLDLRELVCISTWPKEFTPINFGVLNNKITVNNNRTIIAKKDDSSVQLVSLPVRMIRILFALFIILCLIIVSLLVYMFIFRQQMNRMNSIKVNEYIGMTEFDKNSNLIPAILYNGGSNRYEHSDLAIMMYNSNNNIYEGNIYEPVESLEHIDDVHMYHTIKININNNNNNTNTYNYSDNYSDISTIGYLQNLKHEERDNSIYGMEEFDVELALATTPTNNELSIVTNNNQNNYNQLNRSSSMFMKPNSIYET